MKINLRYLLVLLLPLQIILFKGTVLGFSPVGYYQDKGHWGFLLGPGVPVGNFGSSDPKNFSPGYAYPGPFTEVNFSRQVVGALGLRGTLRSHLFFLNKRAIKGQATRNADRYSTYEIEADNWFTGGAFIGPYLSFELDRNGKKHFDFKTLFGYSATALPGLLVTRDPDGQTKQVWAWQERKWDTKLAFIGGPALRTEIRRDVQLHVSLDTYISNPYFENVRYTNQYWNSSFNSTEFITSVNLGVGLSWVF